MSGNHHAVYQWFKVNDTAMQWLPESPKKKDSRCDDCGEVVPADAKRLRIDNGAGPDRKAGKGKRHSYVCRRCSYSYTGEGSDQT